MGTRIELQAMLEDLLESKEVYYQPPESIRMSYPAIVYSREGTHSRKADDAIYIRSNRYTITVISKRPDHPVINKLLEIPYCSYDRPYVVDNLHHDTFTLYF